MKPGLTIARAGPSVQLPFFGVDYAWVHFDSGGTIRDAVGVSSVNRNSTGRFTINFTNPWISSTAYACAVICRYSANNLKGAIYPGSAPQVGNIQLGFNNGAGSYLDPNRTWVLFWGISTVPSEIAARPAFCQFNASGTLLAGSVGIASVNRVATGRFDITFDQAFDAAESFAMSAIGRRDDGANDDIFAGIHSSGNPTSTVAQVFFQASNGAGLNPGIATFMALGKGPKYTGPKLLPAWGQVHQNDGSLFADSGNILSVTRINSARFTPNFNPWALATSWALGSLARRTTNSDIKGSIRQSTSITTTAATVQFSNAAGSSQAPDSRIHFLALGRAA